MNIQPEPHAAKPSHSSQDLQTGAEYLSFRLGREEYGIDILQVQEIRGHETPTRMVSDRPCMKGVVNLRGVIVPIVDLRILLGMAEAPEASDRATVVITLGQQVVGMVVDAVSDVIRLQAKDIRPAPTFGASARTDHIVGLGTPGGDDARMLILIDVCRLLLVNPDAAGAPAVH